MSSHTLCLPVCLSPYTLGMLSISRWDHMANKRKSSCIVSWYGICAQKQISKPISWLLFELWYDRCFTFFILLILALMSRLKSHKTGALKFISLNKWFLASNCPSSAANGVSPEVLYSDLFQLSQKGADNEKNISLLSHCIWRFTLYFY